MFQSPFALQYFAKFVAQHFEREFGVSGVSVYSEIKAGLNGREPQYTVSPEVDLASVEYDLFSSNRWILPLEPIKPIPLAKI
jgi:hypothetical protein